MLSVFIAFLAGTMDSIVQASASLIGAMTGPLLAVFVIGMLVPYVRKNGAIYGIFLGLVFAWWLTLGSIIYPRAGDDLPTSNAQCAADNGTHVSFTPGDELVSRGSFDPPAVPEGMLAFYHISFIWITGVGFVATLIISAIVTALFGKGTNPLEVVGDFPYSSLLVEVCTLIDCFHSRPQTTRRIRLTPGILRRSRVVS